jgi:hypothetical protein
VPQYESSDNDSLQYTTEVGGNTSKATYQEAVEFHARVEKTPVPIILLKFKKITVTQPTEYPSGEEYTESVPQYESSDNDSLQYTTEVGGNTSKATYQIHC